MQGNTGLRLVNQGWDESLDPTTAPYGVLMASTYWDKMTPEERSAEVKRRMATRNAKSLRKKKPKSKKGTRKYTKRAPKSRKNTQERGHTHHEETHDGEQAKAHVSYIFGKVETIIEYYANSNGISKSALAQGVADLLRR